MSTTPDVATFDQVIENFRSLANPNVNQSYKIWFYQGDNYLGANLDRIFNGNIYHALLAIDKYLIENTKRKHSYLFEQYDQCFEEADEAPNTIEDTTQTMVNYCTDSSNGTLHIKEFTIDSFRLDRITKRAGPRT